MAAQPQILPPVRIESDTQARIPLPKKLLDFPIEDVVDSTLTFLPGRLDLIHKAPPLARGRINPLYAKLYLDSSFATSLHGSYYNLSKTVPLLAFDARLAIPNSTSIMTSFGLSSLGRVNKEVDIEVNLGLNSTSRDSLDSRLLYINGSNEQTELKLSNMKLRELRTSVSLESTKQEYAIQTDKDIFFGLRHSHIMTWNTNSIYNDLLFQNKAVAMSVKYDYPVDPSLLSSLRVGLQTDFRHLFPAIDFHKRVILAHDLYLEISNQSSIRNWQHLTLNSQHPWSLAPNRNQMTVTPLDMTLSAYQSFSDEELFETLAASWHSKYSTNMPQLATLNSSGQTQMFFADQIDNSVVFETRFRISDLIMTQNLNLNLTHLPESSWKRKPFTPLISAHTTTSKDIGAATLRFILDQLYIQQDEFGKALPGIFDLDLSLEYPLLKDLQLIAGIDNLFNTPYHDYGNLPKRGRNIQISLRYLPFR